MKTKTVKSDHFPIILTFKGLPVNTSYSKTKTFSRVIWNTNKPGGWKDYNELTMNNETFNMISENEIDDIDETLAIFNKAHDEVKKEAFGKVKFKKKKHDFNDGRSTFEVSSSRSTNF